MDEKARSSKEHYNQALGYENKDLDAAVRLYKLVGFRTSKKKNAKLEAKMIFLHNRSRFVFCSLILCLSLGFVSCKDARPDPKEELLGSLKGANLEGFYFETRDDDAQEIASLTNGIIADAIKLDSDATLVLRYTRVKDKKANTSKIYKTEAIKTGNQLTLQVTDIATGGSVIKETGEFPAPPAATIDTQCNPAFKSVEDCICSQRAALLFEANRTCKTQQGNAFCCINGTQLISVHFFVMPTRLICLIGVFEGINELVFFR